MWTRALALLLTMMTGFSGLVYEVAWQKYLATLLGSHSEATAAVLAIFLGGLAVGYSVFGATTARSWRAPARAARRRGCSSSTAGSRRRSALWVVAFPLLFGLAQAPVVSHATPTHRSSPSASTWCSPCC